MPQNKRLADLMAQSPVSAWAAPVPQNRPTTIGARPQSVVERLGKLLAEIGVVDQDTADSLPAIGNMVTNPLSAIGAILRQKPQTEADIPQAQVPGLLGQIVYHGSPNLVPDEIYSPKDYAHYFYDKKIKGKIVDDAKIVGDKLGIPVVRDYADIPATQSDDVVRVYHGTHHPYLPSIAEKGLLPGGGHYTGSPLLASTHPQFRIPGTKRAYGDVVVVADVPRDYIYGMSDVVTLPQVEPDKFKGFYVYPQEFDDGLSPQMFGARQGDWAAVHAIGSEYRSENMRVLTDALRRGAKIPPETLIEIADAYPEIARQFPAVFSSVVAK